ncbi:UNVERIFIED_CONTAM: Aspartate--tRNA ligase 2, cytoplasmic [Sesamum calycinum]|uniref:aspartate--tRNA ligase n=1 Tax=Sesamum calycinum TaxID=2727403 RepID=A0AAW2QWB2_9LAMI
MSSEEPLQNPPSEENPEKKLSKKELAKLERQRKRQEAAAAASAAAGVSGVTLETEDPLAANYGDVPLNDLQSKEISGKKWTEVKDLTNELKDQDVVSPQMVKFATSLSRESIVDIEGVISVPTQPITGASQQVEIQVRKLYCVNKAVPALPINIEDAARSDLEIEKALQAGEQLVRVNQDTRLNFRVLDMRTPANQAIFRIQCQVENIFRQFLLSEGFVGIHTPKLIAGSSEGGSAVFRFDYKGTPACLAQSPQLHKQMSICGDFGRVFEVGPVFRAEDSFTHRHLCEFTGLDVEMEIKEHYSEYLRKTLRLTFEEGVQMLKEAGVEIDPLGDLNTESERKLGQLVLEKYGTEFYILHRYPLAVRPFYTMPCHDNPKYSNSFDVFIRLFIITVYVTDSWVLLERYGAPPHGGFGVGLERVVMLFCALNNIRKTSLFPRDPQRITP